MSLVSARHPASRISYPDLLTLSVGGPGAYTSGGGWIGGGFGFEGAVEGALIAGVLNRLTTRRHVKTVVRVSGPRVEWNVSTSTATPEDVEIQLSPVRGYLLERKARLPIENADHADETGGSAFCTNCGQPLPPAARFCGACGSAR